MRIGILGSGLMGSKLGTIFARAGHDEAFSYSRSERKLKRLAREAGGRAGAGLPRHAALNADALLLAVHWSRVNDVLKQAGDPRSRRFDASHSQRPRCPAVPSNILLGVGKVWQLSC
jgi:predicted dinucleotide-binding enzyme